MRLNARSDWENWQVQFEALARTEDVWNLVTGPAKAKSMPEEPMPPEINVSTQATSMATRSQSMTQEPDSNERSVPITQSPAYIDYQIKWQIYQSHLKLYLMESKSIRNVKQWIRETVSPHYQRICCKPSGSLKDWYSMLKNQLSVSKTEMAKDARETYHLAIRTPKIKDLDSWIHDWERAMDLAIEKDLPIASSALEWFDDFINTIRSIAPFWVESYKIIKKEEIEDNSLMPQTVALDFRDATRHLIKGGKTAKVGKGAFGPTFNQDDSDKLQQEDHENSKGRTKKRKRSSESQEEKPKLSGTKSACKGCGYFHSELNCYYLFPEKAPDWFTERVHICRTVDRALKEDPSLAELVQKMKKLKSSKKSEKPPESNENQED
jgi:hypothetical protein